MSGVAPARRLTGKCLFCQTLPIRPRILHLQQRNTSSGRGKGDDGAVDNQSPPKRSNPVLEEYQRLHGSSPASQQQQQQQQRPAAGDLSATSIFEDERRVRKQQETAVKESDEDIAPKTGGRTRNPEHILRVTDPDPAARERYERKKVIQMIRKGGRLSKPQLLKRTEREHLAKSHNLKTSTKKLGMLARQIAGKTLDDAITQMRFSKKKAAQDVLKHLEFARDEAVVTRGMGLGNVETPDTAPTLNHASLSITGATVKPKTTPAPGVPIQIQLPTGARHTVPDLSNIYISQAWVGRGPYGKLPDYRARGRTYIMRTPWTSLSVVLKEEVTRVREWKEREEKRRRHLGLGVEVGVGEKRAGWTHLPDRPVQWQRGWYTF